MLIGNPMIYRQLPVEEALAKTVGGGFDALELWPPQIAEFRTPRLRERLRDQIRRLGAEPVRLNCADCDYFQILSSRDDVDRALAGLKKHIDEAIDLGMTQVLTWEGRRPPNLDRRGAYGEVLDRTTDLFARACQYASERGVELTLEVHPFTLGIDVEWLVALCDRLAGAPLSVTYDCCHFGVGLPDAYITAIDRLGRRIGHVHFSDSDRRSSEVHFAPGVGELDLDGIVAALERSEFQGSMMLDLWLYPLPDEGTQIGVPYVRRVIERLERSRQGASR